MLAFKPLLILMAFFVSVASAELPFEAAWADTPHRVLILGDSLTEGYGVAKDDAFPSILQDELKNDGHPQTQIINAGISGSTSSSGPSRFKWSLRSKPDILVLALGGNDGLRGLKPDEMKKNLKAVIELAKQNGVRVLLLGMKAPPNLGRAYTHSFEKVFTELSKEEKVPLMPFMLDGIAGDPSLNQSDGIHPNEKGHKRLAHDIKKFLEPLL
jgi:acyl-CoA thioesterase-1